MTTTDPGLAPVPRAVRAAREDLAAGFCRRAGRDAAAERRIDACARGLVEAIRARAGGLGGIEDFLHAYSLSTKEGLALMVLAEALLRVPDAATADRLIEDKLAAGRWFDGDVKSTALLVSASAWTLGIAARIIHPGETPATSSTPSSNVSACPPCAPRRARPCGSSARISCLARPSRKPWPRPQSPRIPLFVRHAGRRRAHRR